MIEADEYGHRPVNDWGDGDLPAPYAIGDRLELVERNERLGDIGDGPFVVVSAFSIDEGDGWYFRVAEHDAGPTGPVSGRLHVASADRSSFATDTDWMAGFRLVETADPDGLALRQATLAEGWTFDERGICPTCGATLPAEPLYFQPPDDQR